MFIIPDFQDFTESVQGTYCLILSSIHDELASGTLKLAKAVALTTKSLRVSSIPSAATVSFRSEVNLVINVEKNKTEHQQNKQLVKKSIQTILHTQKRSDVSLFHEHESDLL